MRGLICWNTHVGDSIRPPCWPSRGQQMLHQRWISRNVHHVHLCQVLIRLPTLALKPGVDFNSSSKQGYQWSHERTCVHQILFIEKLPLCQILSLYFISKIQYIMSNYTVKIRVIHSFLQLYFIFQRLAMDGAQQF